VIIKKALASGHVKDPDAAVRFAVDYPGVTSVVVGTITPSHLQENVAALTIPVDRS
jgi:aryl-alcohol dehydrogenase-like predicted oxidoreductase